MQKQKNKKPPCVKCKRHRAYVDYHYATTHWCFTGKYNNVSGMEVTHGCWWYRRTPWCQFEDKIKSNTSDGGKKLYEKIIEDLNGIKVSDWRVNATIGSKTEKFVSDITEVASRSKDE